MNESLTMPLPQTVGHWPKSMRRAPGSLSPAPACDAPEAVCVSVTEDGRAVQLPGADSELPPRLHAHQAAGVPGCKLEQRSQQVHQCLITAAACKSHACQPISVQDLASQTKPCSAAADLLVADQDKHVCSTGHLGRAHD